jgi:hypothetical protein
MKQPNSLGPRGSAFWRQITGEFEMSVAERELLTEVARTLDLLEELAAAPSGPSRMSEARQQRLVLHRLLSSLNLPAEEAPDSPTTTRARKAAQSRWAGHQLRKETNSA